MQTTEIEFEDINFIVKFEYYQAVKANHDIEHNPHPGEPAYVEIWEIYLKSDPDKTDLLNLFSGSQISFIENLVMKQMED